MAKVLWRANERVTKDDGSLATSGTLTIRVADTSTTAVAFTDRGLSVEQSIFNIGSDGYLEGRPTIYGDDAVGYDAYIQSTGVYGAAWTIPDLAIAESSVSDEGAAELPFRNAINNGDFAVWTGGSSYSNISGDGDGDEVADGWYFTQPSAASNAVSRQDGFAIGVDPARARYSLRFGRPNGSSSTNKLRLWTRIPTADVYRLRGQEVTLSFDAVAGANFSGTGLGLIVATGTTENEDGDLIDSGGFGGHVNALATAQSIDTTATRYEFTFTLAANIKEIGLQFAYTGVGTAGAADYVQIQNVQLEIAASANDFAAPPEPVEFLIARLGDGGKLVLASSALDSNLAIVGTTLSVTGDTDGTLAGNSDLRVPTQKAVKTYADALIAAADAMVFKGVIDCSSNPNYPAANRGYTYRVSVAGKIGGGSGPNVENGDLLLCMTDSTASGTHAGVGSAWAISQTDIDGAYFAGGTDVAVADGGTGASTAGGALTNLGAAASARTLTAGLGISGGGDLSADRSFAFDPAELTDTTFVLADSIVFLDATDSLPKRRLWSSVVSDQALTQHNGDVLFTDTDWRISANTSDGADSSVLRLGGGGNATSVTRGAHIALYGNEHASAGQLYLRSGDAGGGIDMSAGGTNFLVLTGSVLVVGTFRGRTQISSETGGTLTSASANAQVNLASDPTFNSAVFTAGDRGEFYAGASARTITQGSGMTLRLDSTSTTGNRSLPARGRASWYAVSASEIVITGSGVS